MSTFDELTRGTSELAKRVEDFFKSICTTFSPIPIIGVEQTSSSGIPSESQSCTTSHSLDDHPTRRRRNTYFTDGMPDSKKQKGLNLIVVVHLLPTLPAYLRALKHVGNIKVIIFKGPADASRPEHMAAMAKWVKNHAEFGPAVRAITKEELKQKENVISLLSDATSSDGEEILIIDIGGYFAPCLWELCNLDTSKCKWKLLGIVEDTENGHQKYHKELDRFPTKPHPNIYSVARSQMKATEDYNVGKSIVRAADSVLRQSLDLRLEDYCVIGVLGFGKIGNSIAMHLRQQHIGMVMVYDVNPAIMLRAISHDFVICTKEEMLQKASIIFCATGNKSLTYNDLLLVGPNMNQLIIVSCTSADDELDVHDGLQNHKNDSTDPLNFSRYTVQCLNGKNVQVILLCDGNAVNFHCRAVLGESIRSVQAAMMVCALKLKQMAFNNESKLGINQLTNEDEMTIARLWLQHFPRLDVRLITNISSAHTQYDTNSVNEAVGDLPVDKDSIEELKEYLGLLRTGDIDPIDFMDSERKLIITAPRGFGKTAVLFSLIHDIRNYYDLIWWFDCNDSLNNTLLSLAQELRVPTGKSSSGQIQEDLLKAILSSLKVNNFLLIVDNVQALDGDECFSVSADEAYCTDSSKKTVRGFKCNSFLSALDNAIEDPSVRRQRRRHIVALYTSENIDQQSEVEPMIASVEKRMNWLYTTLEDINVDQALEWIIGKLPLELKTGNRRIPEQLIREILSFDLRRLAIRLTAVFLLDREITESELRQITDANSKDLLSRWIKLALKILQEKEELVFLCVQVASLINTQSISCEVFHRLYDILLESKDAKNISSKSYEMNWDSFWATLLRSLKRYCMLKQNFLAPIIYTHVTQYPAPSDYIEVYSIPSTYVKAIRTPILNDYTSRVWQYAFQLLNKGFDYDYYASTADENFRYEQNVGHYLDHATILIKYVQNWTDSDLYATQLGELLCRLGSYYLNERRMHSEAAKLYSKAMGLFNQSVDSKQSMESFLLHWHATLMWHISEQLSFGEDVRSNEEFIVKINDVYKQLEKNKSDESRKYEIEAIIAIARIRIQNAENENNSERKSHYRVEDIETELTSILHNEEKIAIRTQSLLLQILGRTYSVLKNYEKAVKCFRKSLKLREHVLRPGHFDLARAKYRLASSYVEHIDAMNEQERNKNMNQVIEKLNEAMAHCDAASKMQRNSLAVDHEHLKECSDLHRRIDEVLEIIKSKNPVQ